MSEPRLRPARAAVLIGLAAVLACSSASKGPNGGPGAGANGAASSSGFFPTDNTPPDAGVVPCLSQQAEVIQGKRPVDIIFVIDNSSSMAEEIGDVERQINENFTSIIDKSDTDYRVILLSAHGRHDVDGTGTGDPGRIQRICVRAPLSGTSCDPIPDRPVETSKFVQYDVLVNSQDALCKVITTFNSPDAKNVHPKGWSESLRAGAFKLFAVITDDRVNTSCNGFTFDDKNDDPRAGAAAAGTFDSVLFSLSPLHFGSAKRRNYVWHSIIGLAPFDESDLTKPHPPDAPIVTKTCEPSAESPAPGYQALSRLTGGLRYPTCGLDFTTIFRSMALDVINRTVLACDYKMPEASATGAIDPSTVIVRYTSKSSETDFAKVENAAACGPNKFYVEGARIRLCDDACGVVQNDVNAQVKLLFGCQPKGAQ